MQREQGVIRVDSGEWRQAGKVCGMNSNSVCSLYGERNKGNICLQTPDATTVCVDVFCSVFAYYYFCVLGGISACLFVTV